MANKIKFGPAGIGPVKQAISNLEAYSKLGIKACEIAFTYGAYIKNKQDALEIRKAADRLGIKLSIHAPYWINLNSKDKEKIKKSKERILRCCEVGSWLGAYMVVFHPGYYGGMEKEETYQNIKKEILEILKEVKKNNWDVKLGAETTGKINVFGSIDEIACLVKETNCGFVLDFAHILARYKKIDWEKINQRFGKYNHWHCHFSGIEYGEKGERRHKKTSVEDWKELLKNIPNNKNIIIINESPYCVEDSVEGLRLIG